MSFGWLFAQTIERVEVEGAKYVPEEIIRGLIKAKEGLSYDPSAIREDIRRLYRTGFFDSIEVYEERVGDRLILLYKVKDLPVIYKIEFVGNRKIKAEELEKKIGIETEVGKINIEELTREYTSSPAIEEKVEVQRRLRLGRVLTREEMEVIKSRIVQAYEREGYPRVQVSYELVPKKGASKLVYKIVEGEPEYVSAIEIKGNKSFRKGKLLEIMQTKQPSLLALRLKPSFNEELLKEDVRKIEEFYRSEGFLEVQTSYQVKKENNRYKVVVEIKEGPRYKLKELKVEGNTYFSRRELVGDVLKKNRGGFYRTSVIENLINNVKNKYSQIGFLNVSPDREEQVDKEKKEVSVILRIYEGEPVYAGRIEVRGNYETRDYVIRREMRVQEGDLINQRELERSRTRIFNLGYYQDVDIDLAPSDRNRWNIETKIRERFTGQFSVGLGYNQVSGVSGFLSVRKGNFLGTGDIAGFSISYGSRLRDNSLSYTKKWFLNRTMDLSGSLYDRRVEYTAYTVSRTGLDLTLSREIGEYWRISGGVSAQIVKYSDISPSASPLVLQEAGTRQSRKLSFGLSRDTRDNYLFPTKGSLTELGYTVAIPVAGGTERFNKVSLSHQTFIKDTLLDTGLILTFKGALGFVEPYGKKTIPLDERFFVGGDFTVRGYKYGYAGPLDPNTLEPVGAEKQLILSAEANYPLYKRILFLSAFYDTGLGFDELKELKTQNLRGGYGVGLRFITPMAPIKLDWAFKTKKVPGDTSRSRVHFVLGFFF
ncbi:outer membrane protein assembly factor BamA [Thermocrinis sp.]